MSVKNFKIGTGLDLEGLILTTANSELLVDGSALATQTYVDSAINGVTVDPSGWAGNYIDWDGTQFNLSISSLVTDLIADNNFVSLDGTQTLSSKTIISPTFADGPAGTETWSVSATELSYLDGVTSNIQTQLDAKLDSGDIYTDEDAVNAIAAELTPNGGISYVSGSGFEIDSSIIASRAYVDSVAQGLDVKASVAVAATGNVNINGIDSSIDGFPTGSSGTRYLLKSQTSATENGIYVDNGDGTVSRASDATFDPSIGPEWGTLTKGSFVFVEGGTYAGKGYVVSDIADTNSDQFYEVTWTQFSETGNYITSVSDNLTVTNGVLSLDSTVVTTTDTQTLTNKTLESPTITIPNILVTGTVNVVYGINNSVSLLGPNYGNWGYVGPLGSGSLVGTQIHIVAAGQGIDDTFTIASVDNQTNGSTYLTVNESVTPHSQFSATVTAGNSDEISTLELSYLNNVTSNIQTQLNAKLDSADIYTDEDAVNAIAAAIPFGSGITYTANVGFDIDTNYIATQSYVTGLGYLTSSDLSDYVTSSSLTTTLGDYVTSSTLSGYNYATETYANNAASNLINDSGTDATSVWSSYKTSSEINSAIQNVIGMAPSALDTLQELAAAIDNDGSYASSITTALSGKQATLTAGNGIAIDGSNNITVDLNDIAGTGITVNGNQLEAAPAYITSVDASFAVADGELSLSDTITIASVELTDSVANVTAASDVFGNSSTSTYAMGSAVTVGTLPTGTDVADVFITLQDTTGASRTSKLTYVNTGGDAPTWTEYGIIVSGSFPATTISFDSSGNILANVTGLNNYAAKGVVTVLK
jgi:hypothetical protein